MCDHYDVTGVTMGTSVTRAVSAMVIKPRRHVERHENSVLVTMHNQQNYMEKTQAP
jgi:hypothetical protein